MSEKKSIQMVDLKTQYHRIKNEIDEAVLEVIENTAYINGPEVKAFARELAEYNRVKHVITCGNGTDALQIALMAIDAKPGNEVIVPAFTYVATVEVIALLQLVPVFIDVTPDSFQLDTTQLESLITDKTVAIVPVHLYGQCSDMETINQIAHKHQIAVIEDTAQAIGAEFSFTNGTKARAGTMGTIGTTSFFPSKNLGCFGDGGAIFTNDDQLANKLQMIANHGQSRKYYHDSIGVNSRLDTLQAAILRVKLKHLSRYTASRNEVADRYDAAFGGHSDIQIPVRAANSTHVFHQYTIKVNNGRRDEFQEYMKSEGIPTMIYYPLPVHLQKAYQHYGYKKGDILVSEQLCDEIISLPIHTEMDPAEQQYIINTTLKFFN
jgi:UDP-2-acetamido-2-deoxy-ribo-hexuluronate aminotransferase